MATPALTRFAWLSIGAALTTIALKTEAYRRTGSVGLLSDAAESLVNLVAAVVALLMLSFAARPADHRHPFGHGKAEYFASGFEGALILVAATGIAVAAWDRWRHPQPLAELDLGMAISAGAAGINLAVALILLRAGRQYGSITLEADGRHLLTDVWTTGAILLALAAVRWTGWQLLDPLIAFLAAGQIVWSGIHLVFRSVSGLLDSAMPEREQALIEAILQRYREAGIEFHDLRTRSSGTGRFMTVHVLVPGHYTVQEGHDLVERIEDEIRQVLSNMTVVTHLEPLEDAASFAHERLETPPPVAAGTGDSAEDGQNHGRRRLRTTGMSLLVLGSAASLMLPGGYAGIALGVGLLGLAAGVHGSRTGRGRLSRTRPG